MGGLFLTQNGGLFIADEDVDKLERMASQAAEQAAAAQKAPKKGRGGESDAEGLMQKLAKKKAESVWVKDPNPNLLRARALREGYEEKSE